MTAIPWPISNRYTLWRPQISLQTAEGVRKLTQETARNLADVIVLPAKTP